MSKRPTIQQIDMSPSGIYLDYSGGELAEWPVIGWALVDYGSRQEIQPVAHTDVGAVVMPNNPERGGLYPIFHDNEEN